MPLVLKIQDPLYTIMSVADTKHPIINLSCLSTNLTYDDVTALGGHREDPLAKAEGGHHRILPAAVLVPAAA